MKRFLANIICLYFFAVSFPFYLSAQSDLDLKIDSLKKALLLIDGKDYAHTLLSIASKYVDKDLDSASHYLALGQKLAEKRGYQHQEAISYSLLGKIHNSKGELVLAQENYNIALKLAADLTGREQRELFAHLNNHIGIIHAKKGEYDDALKYFLSALEVWEEQGHKKRTAMILGNVGTLHSKIGDYDKALEALLKARQISLSINDRLRVASSMHNLGDVYRLKGEYRNALNAYQKSLDIKIELDRKSRQVITLQSLGELYTIMGLYQNAQNTLLKGLAIADELNNQHYRQKIFFSLGKLKAAEKKYTQAIDYYEKSLAIAHELSLKNELKEILNNLAETHTKLNNFEAAYHYLLARQTLTDSLNNAEYREKLANLGAKYDLDQKKGEIERLSIEQQVKTSQLWALTAFALFALSALIASLIFIRHKKKASKLLMAHNAEIAATNKLLAEKQNEIAEQNALLSNQSKEINRQNTQLKQSNTDLRQFAYAVSHDLREPLRTIRSYLQLLERRYKAQLDNSAQDFIEFAVDGASRMDTLLQDLLAYSRIGRESAIKNTIDLNRILRKVEDSLQHQISQNNAQIIFPPLPYLKGFEPQIYLLFQNLISNAIKFRGEVSPKINIDVRQENGHYLLMVADNGIGIEEAHRERIFTLFQRLHPRSQYEGTGMGLAICKKIVQNHGGEIWVDSRIGEGSTFFIRIPSGVIADKREEPMS